jgi:hypothetical protein
VAGFVDTKINALLAHKSQWQSTMHIDRDPRAEQGRFEEKLHAEARAHGLRAGIREAEAFARIDDL